MDPFDDALPERDPLSVRLEAWIGENLHRAEPLGHAWVTADRYAFQLILACVMHDVLERWMARFDEREVLK